jgi:hypothetical protein
VIDWAGRLKLVATAAAVEVPSTIFEFNAFWFPALYVCVVRFPVSDVLTETFCADAVLALMRATTTWPSGSTDWNPNVSTLSAELDRSGTVSNESCAFGLASSEARR